MIDDTLELAAQASSRQEVATEYRPRRALAEDAEPVNHGKPDQGEVPVFQPAGSAASIPPNQWAAPVGPPIVEDLASGQRQTGAISAVGVARELDRLRSADGRWVCLNSVPGGKTGTEIDHLVIGPGGVFTVNAGRHANGRAWTGNAIRVGRDEAQRVAQLLTAMTRICIRVQGLIVPVGAKNDVVRQPSNIVRIVNHSELVDYLLSQPPYLDGATRTRITGFARLSSTWSG